MLEPHGSPMKWPGTGGEEEAGDAGIQTARVPQPRAQDDAAVHYVFQRESQEPEMPSLAPKQRWAVGEDNIVENQDKWKNATPISMNNIQQQGSVQIKSSQTNPQTFMSQAISSVGTLAINPSVIGSHPAHITTNMVHTQLAPLQNHTLGNSLTIQNSAMMLPTLQGMQNAPQLGQQGLYDIHQHHANPMQAMNGIGKSAEHLMYLSQAGMLAPGTNQFLQQGQNQLGLTPVAAIRNQNSALPFLNSVSNYYSTLADSEELIHLKDLNAAQTCPQEEPHQLMSESVSSEQQINIMYDDNNILAADSGELIHLKVLNAAQTCPQEELHQLMSESVSSEQQMYNIIMYDDDVSAAVPELRIFRQFSKTMTKSANVGFIISESEEEPYSDRDSIADPAYSPGTSISHYSDSQDKTIEVPSNLLDKPVDCKPVLTRKRQRKPDSWKRNKLRRLRLEGKEYLSEKGNIVRAKAVQPVNCKCYYKCNEKFSMEQRQTIFQDYLSLEDERSKWSYIANCIKKQKPKRRYQSQIPENGNQPNRPKKMYTLIYNLTCSDTTHQVCKQFFLKTLDVSGKKVETSLSKKSETGVVTPDQRGKKPAPNKIPEDRKGHVRAHIKSMPVIESHYCRSQTKRKYLPTYLSENRLYTDYVEYCKEKEIDPVKPSFYKHVFRTEFNLGFHRPKKDQCDFCAQYKNKNDEDKKNNEEEYQLHLKRKVEARQHKEQDKTRAKTDASFRAYTMDMEKILLSPQVLIGQLYYKRKLKTYNFTIYELAKALAVNYMWHEGNGTKGASEVATCLWNLMLKLDSQVTEVTFYSDTAAGQNRNSILAAMFLRALTVLPNLQIINQKYMESGHSDMECDSVHSTIENRGKKIDIFTPEGWFTVARTAKTTSPPYEVCEMDHSQFIDFKTYSEKLIKNKNKAENGESMNWLKVKWLQYRKEEPLHIFYKNQLSDDEFKRLPIRTARATRREVGEVSVDLGKLYKNKRKIERSKMKDLQELCHKGTIPSAYHDFYLNNLVTGGNSHDSSDSEMENV